MKVRRRSIISRGLGLLLIACTLAGVAGWLEFERQSPEAFSENGLWPSMAWRTRLLKRKLGGELPELSWHELWEMSRVRGAFGLGGIVKQGGSVEGSVVNPYVSDGDLERGAQMFHERCSSCHGTHGVGGHAPPLNRSTYSNGDSDFSLYRAIRDGVPGTAMAAVPLTPVERWQVVGYLRKLQLQQPARPPSAAKQPAIDVDVQRLRAAGSRPDEWITYSGSFSGQRFARASQITKANVSRLRLKWVRQFDNRPSKIEATPIVIDGRIFLSIPPNDVVALDAASGQLLWTYHRAIPDNLALCCGPVNRGLAVSGRLLYLATLDGELVAIDANTGREAWHARVADPSAGYTLTAAPLVVDGLVVVGVAGGEFGVRGYLAAYDALTGRQSWKFFTIPGPGEPNHETWENDAWRTGGGTTWTTGSYDPSLNLIYWGIGNPAPDYSADVRPGDNLYTNSAIALDATSGKLAWHFQFTPHDEHDWDSAQTPILADIEIDGRKSKVLCWANRNGFYYVLDRRNGAFLSGTPFVQQNWAEGLDPAGRPVPVPARNVSATGRLTRPGIAGATNWQNAAYDPTRRLVFVPATEGASVFTKSPAPKRGDRGLYLGSASSLLAPVTTVVRALDAGSGRIKWERMTPSSPDLTLSYSGLLATAGGLVFGAAGGYLYALDSDTGRELWRVALGGDTSASPVSFTVDGQQVVAVSAARAFFLFGL
jgi:alcohol dehydrogenase (cytochrome c)